MSGLDYQPVYVQEELSSLDSEEDQQKQSLKGSAESLYLNRDEKAMEAAFNFRDRFLKEISPTSETPKIIRDVA